MSMPPIEILKALVDMHEIEEQIGKRAADVPYDDLRKVRREAGALWASARVAVYGEPEPDAKPKSKAEAERWERNAKRVRARREATTQE